MEGDLIDLRGKLEARAQEVVSLQHSVHDKESQLSIAQLRIQQVLINACIHDIYNCVNGMNLWYV